MTNDLTYHGLQPAVGGAGTILVEDTHRAVVETVPHLPKHSTQGYAWGYFGSGAADAARSLLLHALGPDALCQVCHLENRRCGNCDEGYIPTPYQRFKATVLSTAPDEWRIPRKWVQSWLSAVWDCATPPPALWTTAGDLDTSPPAATDDGRPYTIVEGHP